MEVNKLNELTLAAKMLLTPFIILITPGVVGNCSVLRLLSHSFNNGKFGKFLLQKFVCQTWLGIIMSQLSHSQLCMLSLQVIKVCCGMSAVMADIKGLMRSFKGPYEALFSQHYKALEGPYKAL